jgi:hypothetical protein
MLIDTHVHWPMNDCPGPAELLGILDQLQIDRAVLLGWEILFKQGRMDQYNTLLAEFCEKSGDRMKPLATVHLYEEGAMAEARRCIEQLGMRGFKFHSWVQGESMFHPVMYELCDYCAARDVPVMFHDGTPAYAMGSQIGVLAQKHPKTKFILGHGGILHYWEEAIEVALQNPNVYIIMCGCHNWGMQRICDQLDPERLLFGTDILNNTTGPMAAYRCEQFRRIDLEVQTRKLISSENALTLYKWDC